MLNIRLWLLLLSCERATSGVWVEPKMGEHGLAFFRSEKSILVSSSKDMT